MRAITVDLQLLVVYDFVRNAAFFFCIFDREFWLQLGGGRRAMPAHAEDLRRPVAIKFGL